VLRWNNEDAPLDVTQVLQEDAVPPHGIHAESELPAVQELLHSQEVI
jgi:hypothetical protein